jgi:hypothetical protein
MDADKGQTKNGKAEKRGKEQIECTVLQLM